jgi:hypothetical protein
MVEQCEFDPRDLVAGPFQSCPKCQMPQLGVVMVSANAYFCRCRACFYSQMFPLPTLRKKIIYIDQFGISNIAKVLEPRLKGHQGTAADPFWFRLFEALELACKSQLVVCPDSDGHQNESLLAPFYTQLRRIYEHFSNGVSFYDSRTIRRIQLVELAEHWLSGETATCTLDAEQVTRGALHGWQSPIGVSACLPCREGLLEELRAVRKAVHQEFQIVFEYWKSEKLSFEQRFANEADGYGRKLLARIAEWRGKIREAHFGLRPADPHDICPPPAVEIVQQVKTSFRQRGLAEEQAWDKTVEFLSSELPTAAPHRQMFGLLYAALAMKAQNGQAKAPNRGMANDITVIADLLPYCDAMFVDNGARALLHDIPNRRKPPYDTKVFSPNIGADFLAYLAELVSSAPEEHRALVRRVYGDDYTRPYKEILASVK